MAEKKRALAVVVLAAGQGKRMRSDRAKVLHEIAGASLVSHVLAASQALKPERTVVVVGHQGEAVREAVIAAVGDGAKCVVQEEQLGTGHAVLQARKALRGFHGDLVVLCGDVPLVRAATLKRLVSGHRRRERLATVVSMQVDDPDGYGRIVRDPGGENLRIVEHLDADASLRMIDEVNTGLYVFDAAFAFKALGGLDRNNSQGEYYLTDLMARASESGAAGCFELGDDSEGLGINSRYDLANAEVVMQERLLAHWMDRGVTFLDPASTWLSAAARIGVDTVVGPGCRIDGTTKIGKGCTLDGSSFLRDTSIGDGVHVRWGVVTDRARIRKGVFIGPYAHLRPEADLGNDVHIGNFVEVKKSSFGSGSKANHLAYIGDATVGKNTNIGAGTITCNYDGFSKHPTKIGDRVQIGSDSQLVAPVTLGDDAYIAAGSTVTTDVEAGALAFNDKRQRVRPGWVAAARKRIGAKGKKG